MSDFYWKLVQFVWVWVGVCVKMRDSSQSHKQRASERIKDCTSLLALKPKTKHIIVNGNGNCFRNLTDTENIGKEMNNATVNKI